MESDLGNPINYNPEIDPLVQEDEVEPPSDQPPQQYYYQPPNEMPYYQEEKDSVDPFKNIPKSTWIIAFAVFLLGFFMGKTMQPVILRYT